MAAAFKALTDSVNVIHSKIVQGFLQTKSQLLNSYAVQMAPAQNHMKSAPLKLVAWLRAK